MKFGGWLTIGLTLLLSGGPAMAATNLELADQVRVDDALVDYMQDIVEATRRHDLFEVGVSPRGALALMRAARASAMLQGRDYCVPDDFKLLASAVCAHRVVSKSYLRDGRATSNDQVILDILEKIPVPT